MNGPAVDEEADKFAGERPEDAQRLRHLEQLAYVLDDSIKVPGTGWRIGLDAVLGVIPVFGDLLGGALSTWVLYNGYRLGASWFTLMRMLGNIFIEILVGAIPIVGDLFDMGFKANQRNVRLLLRHARDPQSVERRSFLYSLAVIGSLTIIMGAALILAAWVAVTAISALVDVLSGRP